MVYPQEATQKAVPAEPCHKVFCPPPSPILPSDSKWLGCRFSSSLAPCEAAAWANDEGFLAWAEGTGAIIIATELKVSAPTSMLNLVGISCVLCHNPRLELQMMGMRPTVLQ